MVALAGADPAALAVIAAGAAQVAATPIVLGVTGGIAVRGKGRAVGRWRLAALVIARAAGLIQREAGPRPLAGVSDALLTRIAAGSVAADRPAPGIIGDRLAVAATAGLADRAAPGWASYARSGPAGVALSAGVAIGVAGRAVVLGLLDAFPVGLPADTGVAFIV